MVDNKITKIPNLERKKISLIPLSDSIKSIILGSVLGDGCLFKEKESYNAFFCFRHSEIQKEYFMWKVNSLLEISTKVVNVQKPDGFSKNNKLFFKTRAISSLTEIYNIIKKKRKLVIKRKWLNFLTPLSLMIWWLDDGSLVCNSRKGTICTDDFSEQGVKILANYLQVVWKVNVRVGSIRGSNKILTNGQLNRKEYFRIWIETEELKKFLRIIIPYIPLRSMIYKVLLIYRDSNFQQRWISEVKTLINKNLVNFVDEELLIKQSKMKYFREKKQRMI